VVVIVVVKVAAVAEAAVELLIVVQSELLMQCMLTMQLAYAHLLKFDFIMRQLSQVKLTWRLKMGTEALSCLPMKSPNKINLGGW